MNNKNITPSPGTLYVVSTPIGNLADLSQRALETLREVDYVVCEDTRKSSILFKKYDIKNKKTLSYHARSSVSKLEKIIKLLSAGQNMALISDAGTPGISDPGFNILKLAREKNIKISPIPGASAFLAALSACSFPSNQFVFYGFLPQKKGKNKILTEIRDGNKTAIFYESPHRISKTLAKISSFFPEREICIAREITKIYEEFIYGTADELLNIFEKKAPKGEMVVLVAPERR